MSELRYLDADGFRCLRLVASNDDEGAVAAVLELARYPWQDVVGWLCAAIVEAAAGWDEAAMARLTSRRLPVAGMIEAVVLAVVAGDAQGVAELGEGDAVETVVLLASVASALVTSRKASSA